MTKTQLGLIETNYVTALFKGEPGSGKSIAACSFPGPILLFDFDNRVRSVSEWYQGQRDDITVAKCDPTEMINELSAISQYNSQGYKTVIIDSLTTLALTCMKYSLDHRGTGREVKRVMRGQIEMFQIEDYGVEQRALDMTISAGINAAISQHINFILIAHVIKTTETNIVTRQSTERRRLLTAGKTIAATIPALFDEAYHFFTRSGMDGRSREYIALTSGNDSDWAKTAMKAVPTEIDFTHQSFYDCLMSSQPSAADSK